jgi:broad specificity phosphatase PhoE
MFDLIQERDVSKVYSARTLVYLIIHGDTLPENQESLSERGHAQVVELARSRVASGVQMIYSSPFKEATATAGILSKEFQIKEETKDCLSEVALGRSRSTLKQLTERLPAMWKDMNRAAPGGESFNTAKRRFGDCMNNIAERSTGGSIAVVTHPMVASLFLSLVRGGPPQLEDWLYLGYASCSAYEYANRGWSLVMPPDDSYLSEPLSIKERLPKDLLQALGV